jgi:hypothetical protein
MKTFLSVQGEGDVVVKEFINCFVLPVCVKCGKQITKNGEKGKLAAAKKKAVGARNFTLAHTSDLIGVVDKVLQ